MAAILKGMEYGLSQLFFSRRGRDAGLLHKCSAFSAHPTPSIPITSPDCGPTGGKLTAQYSQFGSSRFPQLTWDAASIPASAKELLLVCEDPDSPLAAEPNVHGIYCFIPPSTTSFGPADLELVSEEDGVKTIASGYRVGKNRRDIVYIGPRPPRGHGAHRYLFELVALGEKLDQESLSKVPNKEEVAKAIEGKVVGWGLWETSFESTWDPEVEKE